MWHVVLDLMYKSLTATLEKTKDTPVLRFGDFLNSEFYNPVSQKVCADDLQRFFSDLINTRIFHIKGLNLLEAQNSASYF